MKTTTLKTILRLSLVAILAWTVGQTLVSGQEQSGGKRASDLEGTWRVQVTVRDCQTRVPIRTILALNTYLREGSMMETGSGLFMRSPSHGTWHDTGHRNFTATFIFFRFNSDGTPRRYAESHKKHHSRAKPRRVQCRSRHRNLRRKRQPYLNWMCHRNSPTL